MSIIKTKFCQGISDISDSYAGFIIDQWGVLHDGQKPYEGVIECLKELKARKKFVIILSNSGKRSTDNKDRMKKMGIGPSLYNMILTSGEMTWQGLNTQEDNPFKGLGSKCYLISRGDDRSIIEGVETITLVDDIEEATFLLISGADSPQKNLEDYEPVLRKASQMGLKALCANPDSYGVMGSANIMGPGTLARRYKDFGGVVEYIGKPHPPIFQYCIKIMQEKQIYPSQTIMIGDTMAHDILGASLVDIDSCLVKTGLHSGLFTTATTPAETDKILNNLSLQYNNVRPHYLIDELRWGDPLPDRKHKKRRF